MNRVILITGYPCTRKTTLGRQLRKAGWLHIDAETRITTVLTETLKCDYGNTFVEFSKLHDKVVVTHGMPVRFMLKWVPVLQDLGVECYFITDETDESLKRWMTRELHQPEGSEKDQFDNLHVLSNDVLVRMFGSENVMRYGTPCLDLWKERLLNYKPEDRTAQPHPSDKPPGVVSPKTLEQFNDELVNQQLRAQGVPPIPTTAYPTS